MRIRTGYSFRKAVGRIPEVMERLVETGATFAPITDRASTFGYVRWSKAAKEAGLKPVFGVELAVSGDPTAKKPTMDHWTFIAKGHLEPVHILLERATDQFRYEPLLTYPQALEPDCIKIVGPYSDPELIDPETPDLYYALSPSLMPGAFRRYKERGLRPIASGDNYYPRKGDLAFYEVVCGRGASTQTYPQHILSESEWRESLNRFVTDEDIAEALSNRDKVAKQSSAELQQGQILAPDRPFTLREMCVAGAEKLGIDLGDPVYSDRLDRELKLIAEKDFEDYFYIIADMVSWARKRLIVGPARGSSAGSLACYLLEITSVDPIPYGLVFERFIDINRDDLPDIDIDFADQNRHLVFEYMENKYGRDRVARLGTVAMYQPRSAINEAGAALKIPKWLCDNALDGLIQRSGGDARALDTLLDTLTDTPNGKKLLDAHPEIMVATKMEGHPRHSSSHAAGIVLTDHAVHEFVAVDARSGATHCDKKDAEDLGLLKIDALGLTQLSIFEDCLDLLGLPHDYLEGVPLDDPIAFNVLNEHKFSGIFQFAGQALQTLSTQTVITEFNDIVAITALARPGPLASGGASEWVYRKNNWNSQTNKPAPVEYPHPIFEPYLKDTNGVVVYQEQIMSIGREIGGLSWGDTSELRKAMSKSLGKEYFDKFGKPWRAEAVKKGVPQTVADTVWDDMTAFGAWAFNKSHAVSYGIISYWCCYLKGHHPIEFAAATLNHESDASKQLRVLRELHAEGISYVPVHADISTDKWQVGDIDGERKLVGPIGAVRGVGPKLTQQVISARARNEPIPDRVQKLLADPVTDIDSLWPIDDRRKQIVPDLAERSIFTPPVGIGTLDETHKEDREVLVIATPVSIAPMDENEPVRIARRGYEIDRGPTAALLLQLEDDTGIIYAKVSRWKYEKVGRPVVDRGRPKKSLYAIKGTMMAGRRFIMIDAVRYLGDLDPKYKKEG